VALCCQDAAAAWYRAISELLFLLLAQRAADLARLVLGSGDSHVSSGAWQRSAPPCGRRQAGAV